jgi:Kdo2-lipid IVA lauroyltransferase/acyltransferase
LESYLIYILVRFIIFVIGIIPRSAGFILIKLFANFAFYFDRRHRHIAEVNLKIAFPELTKYRRSEIARRSFQNTALNLLEISRFSFLNSNNIASLVGYDSLSGLENFKAAQSKGKGILYLTGHFSAWELLPVAHALHGYPLSFVTRPLDNRRLDRYLEFLRESVGNKVINKINASRLILKNIKENGTVGILMDQNTSLQEGIFSDLFGVPAATTTGVTLLALRTNAPILPGYLTPSHRGRYTIKFLPPIEVIRTGDRNRDIEVNTNYLNKVLEGIIREQPESWLWGHKRWKYQPPENPQDLYSLSERALEQFLKKTRKASDR